MKQRIFSGRVIFDHLAKTAGQAVNSWLRNELGDGCVTENLIGHHGDLIRKYGGEYSLISGHVFFEGMGLNPHYQYITCLREPIDRAISWLYFVLPTSSYDFRDQAERFMASDGADLGEEFAKSVSNPYVEHFAAASGKRNISDEQKLKAALEIVSQYDVIGFYEDLPRFLSNVSQLIGITPSEKLDRVNVTKSRVLVSEISDLLRERIIKLNQLDIKFYKKLWSLRENGRKLNASSDQKYIPYKKNKIQSDEIEGICLIEAKLNTPYDICYGEITELICKFSSRCDFSQLKIEWHIFDSESRCAFATYLDYFGENENMFSGEYAASFVFAANLPDGVYKISIVVKNLIDNERVAWYDKVVEFRVFSVRPFDTNGYTHLPFKPSISRLGSRIVSAIADAVGMWEFLGELGEVCCFDEFTLSLILKNNSSQDWIGTVNNDISIHFAWQAENDDYVLNGEALVNRIEVSAGCSLPLDIRVHAPSLAGKYKLKISPYLKKQNIDFENLGFEPLVIDVNVTDKMIGRYYPGGDIRLLSQVGKRTSAGIMSDSCAGHLIYGPYLQLAAGKYIVEVFYEYEIISNDCWLDVCCDNGVRELAKLQLELGSFGENIAQLPFNLIGPVHDLEVRLWVSELDVLTVKSVNIRPTI